jgi:hypothetical protein
MCAIPNSFRDRAISLYSSSDVRQDADEQHAMSSHELRSAMMLTVEFSKMCILLGKLYQLCHLNKMPVLETVHNISFLSTTLELCSEIAQSRKRIQVFA